MEAVNTTYVRVLIVDDHPVVRFGLRQMLTGLTECNVVGEVGASRELANTLHLTRPDVVLLDLELDDCSGLEALHLLRRESPETRVIIYTAHSDEERVMQATELGVDGYLLKGRPMEELAQAIHTVHQGGSVLDPSVTRQLMQRMNKASGHETDPAGQLSQREIQVLARLSEGLSNREIAKILYICEATVKFHVHAILNKLNANNRTEAVKIGVKKGIIAL